MKTFINDEFILHSKTASVLYHNYAEKSPIFDYHCHLDPREIFENRQFNDLTEIWLGGDHYKWRLMRANGVEERYITGDADHYEKFLKWAETLPKCIGNPLYHWSHLELKRYFGVDELLTPKTAPQIWEACNQKLAENDFSVRRLIVRNNVKALCTTDDPADDLKYHIGLKKDRTFPVKVLPAFRPDKAIHIENDGFADYIGRLSDAAGMKVTAFEELVEALKKRAEFFQSVGCRISDQSFGYPDFTHGTLSEAQAAFKKALSGGALTAAEIAAYQTQLMLALGRIYHSLGFAMQLHVGVIRGINSRMTKLLGPDTGFDSVGNGISADSLAALLDGLDRTDELPRTVFYCLNEKDDAKIASVMGCFQGPGIVGKMQLGSAWWFNDHIDGMRNQLKTLADIGLLSSFVGMLTDSRSFLSYTRHEYFRRILCDLLGEWAEKGEAPKDNAMLGEMVENICFHNAVKFFDIKL